LRNDKCRQIKLNARRRGKTGAPAKRGARWGKKKAPQEGLFVSKRRNYLFFFLEVFFFAFLAVFFFAFFFLAIAASLDALVVFVH